MIFQDRQNDKAEAYRVLSQFFLQPPDEEALAAIRQDFSLDSQEPIDVITEEFNKLFFIRRAGLFPLSRSSHRREASDIRILPASMPALTLP